MKTREETAVEFAKAMGWKYVPESPDELAHFVTNGEDPEKLYPPNWMGRPLHEHLSFVGKVAEAMPDGFVRTFFANVGDDWTDLSHAAMLAAISAKRGAL